MKILDKVELLDRMIKNNLEKIEELDNKMMGVSSIKYRDKIQTSNTNYTTDELICKIIEIKEKTMQDIEELYKIKKIICKTIFKISDVNICNVLYMKYIEFKDLKEISEELNLSYSYIKSLHSKGLKKFYEIYE